MNTRMHGSEDALAEIPCRKVAGRTNSRVLIGGLGMGFTLVGLLLGIGAFGVFIVLLTEAHELAETVWLQARRRPFQPRSRGWRVPIITSASSVP